MDVAQFLATVLVAAIAPVFLYLQQKQQNLREVRLRELDIAAASEERRRQADAKALDDRQQVYSDVLRTVGHYRAGAAPAMAYIESWISDPENAKQGTDRAIEDRSLRFPAQEFAEAQAAVAVARLWAPSTDAMWVTALEAALLRSAKSPLPSINTSCEEAWKRWTTLEDMTNTFARGAEADLKAHAELGQAPAIMGSAQVPALPSAT
jgi:hypothetical protein